VLQRLTNAWRWIESRVMGHVQEASPQYVDDLVDNHTSKETAEQLFDFGKMVLASNDDRIKTIDAKAASVLAYSAAILAFLLTRSAELGTSPVTAVCIGLVGVFAAFACACSWLALQVKPWRALSEATWFPPSTQVLEQPDDLKRWYIKAMHQMHQENHVIVNKKAAWMILGQALMGLAGLSLAVGLAASSIGAFLRPSSSASSVSRPASCSVLVLHRTVRCPTYRADSDFSAPYSKCREVRRAQQGREVSQAVLAAHRLDFPVSRRSNRQPVDSCRSWSFSYRSSRFACV
jgi:hypothetical protein